jgi:hypothetical protein
MELGRFLVYLFLLAKVAHRPIKGLDARFSSFSFFASILPSSDGFSSFSQCVVIRFHSCLAWWKGERS